MDGTTLSKSSNKEKMKEYYHKNKKWKNNIMKKIKNKNVNMDEIVINFFLQKKGKKKRKKKREFDLNCYKKLKPTLWYVKETKNYT